jgi:hypothetical protein
MGASNLLVSIVLIWIRENILYIIHQIEFCVITCHYVLLASTCVIVRHCASLWLYITRHYVSLCVIMRHYASLCICVIMRHYGYFESLRVIFRAYFEGVRQMSFIMSRIITVFFFKKFEFKFKFFQIFSFRVCM